MTDPVDIVYTWVDGDDPAWQRQFRAAADENGRRIDEVALDPARYRSRDELRYSLRSVWAFCGWARRIFIVTAGQVPTWLADDDRVRLVDHSEILPADALPTFNSHAIEAALHHIDGLARALRLLQRRHVRRSADPTRDVLHAERTRTGVPERGPGARRRGRATLGRRHRAPGAGVNCSSNDSVGWSSTSRPLARIRCADRVMERDRGRVPRDGRSARPTADSVLRRDLASPPRSRSTMQSRTGKAVFGDIQTEYVHVESGRLRWHLDRIRLGRRFDTFCINETEDHGTGRRQRRER